MDKKVWIILVIVILVIAGAILMKGEEEKVVIEENLATLPKEKLPETARPINELPEDYLEEQTAPNGSDVEERLARVYDELHTGNSGDYVRQNFPDIEYLFDNTPDGPDRKIFPFFYYYSAEADITFVICNINKTIAVCEGKQDSVIKSGVNAEKCELAKPFEENFI